MHKNDLKLSLIQTDIVWEDKAANFAAYEDKMQDLTGKQHIIVLPEMFSTGFSMAPAGLAEPMQGQSVQWMQRMAQKHRSILTGSLIIEEDGLYYNRLLWVQPDGTIGHYDKRHLFSYAGEDEQYTSGDKRFIASVNGWKVCLMVCYDLRFPVWARNTDPAYDVLLYVANWPEPRNLAWETLLRARAIENLCFTVGVNRTGKDALERNYIGNSSVYGPLGEEIWKQGHKETIETITLQRDTLQQTREKFTFLDDRDRFTLL